MMIQILACLVVLVSVTSALTSSERSQFTGVTFTSSGSNWRVTSDGQPDHATDNFPTNYNPNSIETKSYSFSIPQTPSKASTGSCLPMGPIGFAVNGIPFFSPYTAEGYDAVNGENAEIFDDCDGHPDQMGSYHYHQKPDCVYSGGDNELVGVAMDGYPIYGPKSGGKTYKSDDLDECHGTTVDGAYRYVLTSDFPYVMGCFYGNLVDDSTTQRQNDDTCKIASKAAGFSLSLSLLVVSLISILLHR